jgi:Tfp pilus assembly protein PilP
MKLISGILLLGMTTGYVFGQNPNIITNTKTKLNAVQEQKTADSNEALGGSEASDVKSPYSAKAASAPANQAASHTNAPVKAKTAASVTAAPATPSTHRASKTAHSKQPIEVQNTKAVPDSNKPQEPREINVNGHRDPFVSPVMSRASTGSGCSSGKRCLAIDQINLRGVVKSDDGMIAVVVNALDKAYFLHENDPVFNGYVVRITGDSVIFKETVQDRFGKPFTREVTKKIFTPAV